MGSYHTVMLDLDGTVSDPGIGITNSVAYALQKFGIQVRSREELYPFIGPPLLDSFREYYDFTEEQSEQAVVYYREYFGEKGIFENELYPGMKEFLAELKARGKCVALATSKPEQYAVKILEYFEIDKYFDVAAGATMDKSRSRKADVIRYALGLAKVDDLSSAVMVGDRKHDIEGAKEAGIDAIGVLYGYGDREELEAAGATYLADTPRDILSFL